MVWKKYEGKEMPKYLSPDAPLSILGQYGGTRPEFDRYPSELVRALKSFKSEPFVKSFDIGKGGKYYKLVHLSNKIPEAPDYGLDRGEEISKMSLLFNNHSEASAWLDELDKRIDNDPFNNKVK